MEKEYPNFVEEPAVAYLAAHAVNVDTVAGKKSTDLIIEYGGPDSINPIPELLEISGLSHKFLAESVLEVTPKTFSKYKSPSYLLPARMAETALKIMELYALGIEIFSNKVEFQLWMDKPAYGLNHLIPLTLLRTVTGIDLIIEGVQRIAHGATA